MDDLFEGTNGEGRSYELSIPSLITARATLTPRTQAQHQQCAAPPSRTLRHAHEIGVVPRGRRHGRGNRHPSRGPVQEESRLAFLVMRPIAILFYIRGELFQPPGQRAAHDHAASGNASSLATIAPARSKSAPISSQGCGSRSRGATGCGCSIPRRTRLMRVAPPCGWRSCEGGTSRSRTCRRTARRRRCRGGIPSRRRAAPRRAPPPGRPSPRVRAGCRRLSERSRRARRSRAPGTARARRSAGRPPCALGRPGPTPCACTGRPPRPCRAIPVRSSGGERRRPAWWWGLGLGGRGASGRARAAPSGRRRARAPHGRLAHAPAHPAWRRAGVGPQGP